MHQKELFEVLLLIRQTFYVNLDLTSYNGPIRPPRRRKSKDADDTGDSEPPGEPIAPEVTESQSPSDRNIRGDDDVAAAAAAIDSDAGRIQILGLHELHPLVKYQNHIFRCSWADMVGTDMHFTMPELPPDPSYLRHDKSYDLIAANSVKLVGRRVHLISGPGYVDRGEEGAAAAPTEATGTRRPTTARKLTGQARFLKELMEIKQQRGETDVVPTVFSARRGQNFQDRLRGWARTEERLAEVQRLTRDALEGDTDAIARLEEIYAEIEGVPVEESLQAEAGSQRSQG